MADVPLTPPTRGFAAAPVAADEGPWLLRAARFLAERKVFTAALLTLLIVSGAALLAPVLPLADPLKGDILNRFAKPGADGHLLGTDLLGRDIFSRLIWGGRLSIATGVGANVAVTVISVVFGLLAGYMGGKIDAVIMRLVDVGLAFPGLLLALAILVVLGPSIFNMTLAIVISSVPLNVRFFRGQVLAVRTARFVESARLLGFSDVRIMFREVLPSVMPLIITVTALHATSFFLFTAGFSLLGMGVKPPEPDWGTMIAEGMNAIYEAPFVLLGPTVMITLIAVSFNLMGDEIQRVLSPKESQL